MALDIKTKTAMSVAVVATIVGLTAASCGADASKGVGDSSVNQTNINKAPANVIEFPDQFGNIAWKCAGHVMVLSNTAHDEWGVVDPADCS
jgi:hypothetical protein